LTVEADAARGGRGRGRGPGSKARLALALAGGGLAAIAFPPFGFWPGVFGFGLILRQLDRAPGPHPRRAAFALGWTAGFAYFLISTWWVGEAFLVDVAAHGWQAPFAVLFLAGGLALLWGVAGAAYRWAAPTHVGRVIVFAGVFGLIEWLRGHILTGFPWNLPGELWRAGSAPSQGAALIGAYGMSVLTLAIGGAATLVSRRPTREAWAGMGLALAALAALWVGGALRLSHGPVAAARPIRVRVVQPNIPQTEKWSPEAFRDIVDRYVSLTASPPSGRPADVVIWPEAAIPDLASDFLAPGAWTETAIAGALAPGQILLMGAARAEGPPSRLRYYNSLLALRRQGEGLTPLARYDKHHLVPFGEYMPFDSFMSAIGFKALVNVGDGFTPGPKPVAMNIIGLGWLQPLICYEGLFPSSFARTGPRPQWIVNVSNDAWFGETSGPWQHLNLASYRAIEEGLPMVRGTPTGVSAVIDSYGRPSALIGLGRAGVIDTDLPTISAPTPYSRWRDLPFWIFCLVAAMIGVSSKGTARQARQRTVA
jgi:apolipoprotein N-acyltransferase